MQGGCRVAIACSSTISVHVHLWDGSKWRQQTDTTLADSDGTSPSGELDPSDPITVRELTGASAPDFLIHSTGADTYYLSVVSDVSGRWAPVPFDDTAGSTLGEAIAGVKGKVITVSYNSCNPTCAGAKPTTVPFGYLSASFKPLDPPGSCTGEALASAAHATVAASESGPHASYAITEFACRDGYAAARATNHQEGWSISFRLRGDGWRQLDLDNILPSVGIPPFTYAVLLSALDLGAQDQYFPY